LAAFRQSDHLAGRFVCAKKCPFLDQSLRAKGFEIVPHASFVTLVRESRKAFNVYRPEPANVGHRLHLRITKRIRVAVILMPCPTLSWPLRVGLGRSLWPFHFLRGRVA